MNGWTNIVRIRVDLFNDILRFDYALQIIFCIFKNIIWYDLTANAQTCGFKKNFYKISKKIEKKQKKNRKHFKTISKNISKKNQKNVKICFLKIKKKKKKSKKNPKKFLKKSEKKI